MNRGNDVWRRPISLLALLTGAALAMQASALPEDRNQPIKVSADNAVQETNTVTYTGAVVIIQGTLKIEADKVVINHVDGRMQKLTATGKLAKLEQKPEPDAGLVHAQAQTIIYYQSENRAELLRDALVERDGSTIIGDRIEYFIDSETVRAQGNQGGGRVEMVLQPDQPAGTPAAEAPAPTEPAPAPETTAPEPSPPADTAPPAAQEPR